MNADELEREVRTWIDSKLGISEVPADEALISGGLIDSPDLVRLVTHLERISGLEIPDRDIDADHLDTIEMIVAYVRGRMA